MAHLIKDIRSDIVAARHDVDRNPSEREKETGSYDKGHVTINGLNIAIETPMGGIRSGTDGDGNSWSVVMQVDYGYIKGTDGADGEELDVYLGVQYESDNVYIINQVHHESKEFDELKVMLFFDDERAALLAYDAVFSDGHGIDRVGSIKHMTMEQFLLFMAGGDHSVVAKRSRSKARHISIVRDGSIAGPQARAKIEARYKKALKEEAKVVANYLKAHLKIEKASGPRNKAVDDVPLSNLEEAGNDSVDDFTAAAEEGGASVVIAVGIEETEEGQQLFGLINDRAAAWADRQASDLVTNIDEATRDMINEAVASGIEAGLDVNEIADSIYDLGAFSEERAALIAETEVAAAESNGALEGLKELNSSTSMTVLKTWDTAGDPCDDCQDNEDQGAIPLDDEFNSGDDAPPAHPNCRCALGYDVVENSEEDNGE